MADQFHNVYEDTTRAGAYAGLEFPGTYYLAYRDLPAILRQHCHGTRALDFGCGAGRSSRFLQRLGLQVVGVDISPAMLAQARERDPEGTYLLADDDTLPELPAATFDLILAAFTFDNIPTREAKLRSFGTLRRLLAPHATLVTVVSTPEIYVHEWASFSTRAFPENQAAQSGDRVQIVMLDVPDSRPVEDVVCSDPEYRTLYRAAALQLVETHFPLGQADEPYPWVSETSVPPWAIYVLRPEPTVR
jgi:ubiquinone/menaquinone biosynthesis C-methylase UbiE